MALVKKPVTGMKEILPKEMEIRDYVQGIIKDTYRSFGFNAIETPCLEDINNLCSKQGGENEKLIFKVLKRGEKLKLEEKKLEEQKEQNNIDEAFKKKEFELKKEELQIKRTQANKRKTTSK